MHELPGLATRRSGSSPQESLSRLNVCRQTASDPGSLRAIFSSYLDNQLAPSNVIICEQGSRIVPSRHLWHNRCVRFISPQPGHVQRPLTSSRALPAICRCLFRECDVFFLGTARNTESQISSRVGRLRLMPAMATERGASRRGATNREQSVDDREDATTVGNANRGIKEAVTAAMARARGGVRCRGVQSVALDFGQSRLSGTDGSPGPDWQVVLRAVAEEADGVSQRAKSRTAPIHSSFDSAARRPIVGPQRTDSGLGQWLTPERVARILTV